MYYIYHIPGVKIGCTTNIKRRTERQGFKSYEILEQHEDGWHAGDRELILQAEYGYTVDQTHYMQIKENASKGTESQKGIALSAEHKAKISNALKGKSKENGRTGIPLSAEHKANISIGKKDIPAIKYPCPHCNQLIGGIGNLKQHINNKHKNKD